MRAPGGDAAPPAPCTRQHPPPPSPAPASTVCAAETRRDRMKKRHLRIRNKVTGGGVGGRGWGLEEAAAGAHAAGPPRTWPTTPLLSRPLPQVSGDGDRPRLAVFRSNNHIYAQVIDDTAGSTLVAASTLTPDIREKLAGAGGGNAAAAAMVGARVAELCKAAKIEKVAFDRGGNVFHGRVQALADAAREGGLAF